MNKGNTISIIVAVFAVGLFFGSFAGIYETSGRATRNVDDYISGQAVNGPVLSIVPDIASPNDIMTGSVFPGANGALSGVQIVRIDDFGRPGAVVDDCRSCFCAGNAVCYNRQDFNYILPQVDPGFYSACVTDAATSQRACAMFQVQ